MNDFSNRPIPVPRRVLREFIDSVQALADDPSPENLGFYLAASRALDDTRRNPAQPLCDVAGKWELDGQ